VVREKPKNEEERKRRNKHRSISQARLNRSEVISYWDKNSRLVTRKALGCTRSQRLMIKERSLMMTTEGEEEIDFENWGQRNKQQSISCDKNKGDTDKEFNCFTTKIILVLWLSH
jgi:hypothetical protein